MEICHYDAMQCSSVGVCRLAIANTIELINTYLEFYLN